MAKNNSLMADYSLRHVCMVPSEVAQEAETILAWLLRKKQENFNSLGEKEREKITKKNPEYCHSLTYDEQIVLGPARTSAQIQFIKLAKIRGLFIGNTIADSALISALARSSQEWLYSRKKRDVNASMPLFVVDTYNKVPTFFLAERKTAQLAVVELEPLAILADARKVVSEVQKFSPSPAKEADKPVSAGGQQFHEDVAKTHAAKQAAKDLEASRVANAPTPVIQEETIEALQAKIAALKAAKKAEKNAPKTTPVTVVPNVAPPVVSDGLLKSGIITLE